MIGDNVTGKLLVGVNKKEEKIRGIKIKVTGILSMTYWEVREICEKLSPQFCWDVPLF